MIELAAGGLYTIEALGKIHLGCVDISTVVEQLDAYTCLLYTSIETLRPRVTEWIQEKSYLKD